MRLVIIIASAYISYYTIRYAVLVWKENNKFGATFILLLALTIAGLAFYVNGYVAG